MQQLRIAQLLTSVVFVAAGAGSAVLLAACGGGGSGFTVGTGSSGGGTPAVLAGTFALGQGSANGGAPIFGAVNSDGNGFFAAFSSGSVQEIFSFQSASSNGAIDGPSFAAYAANGNQFSNGTTVQFESSGAPISGSVTQSSGVTTASLTFSTNTTPPSFTDTASITLDHPVLAKTSLSTASGSYQAAYASGAAISSPGLSNSTGATYNVTLGSDGSLAMTSDGGCVFGNGTATPDSNYNVFTLSIPATCNGDTTPVTLRGLAVYLPAKTVVNGVPLATATLLLELDDALNGSSTIKRALALTATPAG